MFSRHLGCEFKQTMMAAINDVYDSSIQRIFSSDVLRRMERITAAQKPVLRSIESKMQHRFVQKQALLQGS